VKESSFIGISAVLIVDVQSIQVHFRRDSYNFGQTSMVICTLKSSFGEIYTEICNIFNIVMYIYSFPLILPFTVSS